jgi:hypothetical protein
MKATSGNFGRGPSTFLDHSQSEEKAGQSENEPQRWFWERNDGSGGAQKQYQKGRARDMNSPFVLKLLHKFQDFDTVTMVMEFGQGLSSLSEFHNLSFVTLSLYSSN